MFKLSIFSFLISFNALANSLYFTTSYIKPNEKKPIVTKQHIFLDKPSVVRYWDIDYNLTLKKCEENFIKIEYETFFTTPGKKEFLTAGIWSGKISDKMEIKHFDKNGKLKYKLTITPTEISKD